MAITLITEPSDWARVNDTNRMIYKFSSNQVTKANYNFHFILKVLNPGDLNPTTIGNFNLHPNRSSFAEFNPSEIYKSYLSTDFDVETLRTKPMYNTAKKFQLECYDFYGTPPAKIPADYWSETNYINVYNGCQQNIPYDYTTLNERGNLKWVMSTGDTKGDWLTDIPEVRLDNTEYAFGYGLFDEDSKPDKIRYTIYYWGLMDNPTDKSYNIFDTNTPSFDQTKTSTRPKYVLDDWEISGPIGTWTFVTGVTYETGLTLGVMNSIGFYSPIGPQQLIKSGLMTPQQQDTWVYYDVDAMKGDVVINKTPIRVIRSASCDRYGEPWQILWLNPHGGFDTYVFDKKTDLNFKIERKTYKQKLPPTYSTYQAGEKILSIKSIGELTLRSKLLTQKESQLISDLIQSPIIYTIKNYQYSGATYPYAVPMICETTQFKYEQKINDKEITAEIVLRESNQKIIQRN